jgi:hypothetical protein
MVMARNLIFLVERNKNSYKQRNQTQIIAKGESAKYIFND